MTTPTTEPQNTPLAETKTQRAVKTGDRWADGGKTWEVVEVMQFGNCRVRTTDYSRVGEMKTSAVRAALAKANGGAL